MSADRDGRSMVHCNGCGFNVERDQVVELTEFVDRCEICKKCEAEPLLRESYRRGFNAGLDAMSKIVDAALARSDLRKPATLYEDPETARQERRRRRGVLDLAAGETSPEGARLLCWGTCGRCSNREMAVLESDYQWSCSACGWFVEATVSTQTAVEP